MNRNTKNIKHLTQIMDSSDSCVDQSVDNLSGDPYEELMCVICQSIMIFPVTLPCSHHFCLQCFKNSKEIVSLLCPLCKNRFSVWSRRAKGRDKDLIDCKKWDLIQQKFPDLVRIRTSDNDWSEVFDEEIIGYRPVVRVLSANGEIRQEFEEFCQKENERLLSEEKANQTLIEQILSENLKISEQNALYLAEVTKNDEQLARLLAEEDSKQLRNRTVI